MYIYNVIFFFTVHVNPPSLTIGKKKSDKTGFTYHLSAQTNNYYCTKEESRVWRSGDPFQCEFAYLSGSTAIQLCCCCCPRRCIRCRYVRMKILSVFSLSVSFRIHRISNVRFHALLYVCMYIVHTNYPLRNEVTPSPST
jgi:hypothetical protein